MKHLIEKQLATLLMVFLISVPAAAESDSLSDFEFEAAHFENAQEQQERQRVVGLPQRANRAIDMGDVIRIDAGRGGRNVQDTGSVVRVAPRGRGAIDCGAVVSVGRQACPRFRER